VSVTVKWDGLAEFKAALRNLPEELTQDAGAIVYAHALEAERIVSGAYPIGPTGNLKNRVKSTAEVSRFGASATVRSAAPHAYLYENGFTRKGKGTARKTPQAAIPVFIRVRRRMVMQLIALVQKAGFKVEAPS
jgi:hypothetical protein